MKLITELTESVEIITEGENNKNLYIKGVFLQSEQKNRNGRIYPKRILEREVVDMIKIMLSKAEHLVNWVIQKDQLLICIVLLTVLQS